MASKRMIAGGVLLAALVGGSLVLGGRTVLGDGFRQASRERDRHGEAEHAGKGGRAGGATDVAPVDDPAYVKECGSCHFPYQPGWLPARSWQAMMAGLEDHFGENAELDPATRASLGALLTDNAADRVPGRHAKAITKGIPEDQAPLRITATRYFQREHHELPEKMVKGNPQVGSFSRCETCHPEAARGSFDEHRVRIPGVERWDD
ncbi:MAG: diheme cytochrome c [Magnetococcales bacterium]|nr:diheme cytochrome c [Magnetococcales bacterium]